MSVSILSLVFEDKIVLQSWRDKGSEELLGHLFNGSVEDFGVT